MEPLDPGRNVGGSGCSKRRISSILKAPRKSSVFQDLKIQENEVESVKPMEKRNSRRVSFAPANDVLLFSEDAKNVSTAESPLLLGTATTKTQNRVPVMATKEISPQIIGIETLLNAPLHASQQRLMVHADSGGDFGEKTVMFSEEDALMDITHNHTTQISSDAELFGEGKAMDLFTDVPPSNSVQATNKSSSLLIDKKANSGMEKRTLSTAVPFLDPDFKNFLSTLAKPSTCSTSAVLTGITPSSEKTKSSSFPSEKQSSDVDKENQAPKSLNGSRNMGEAFRSSALCPEEDVSMDITEAQTGHILLDDDDPFQCLFPSQEMYKNSERRASQAREMKKQQGLQSLDSNNVKAEKSVPSVHVPQENHTVTSTLKNECGEKTDELMDITQSNTGNIKSSLLANTQISAYCCDPQFTKSTPSLSKTIDSGKNPQNPTIQPIAAPSSKQTISTDYFLSKHKMPWNDDKENGSLSTNRSCRDTMSVISPNGDISMDITEIQTGCIMGGNASMEMNEVQTGRVIGNTSMEMTEVQTGCIMGGNASMEMTEVQTGRIIGNTSMEMTVVQTGCIMGGNTSMEMTEVQTGCIMGGNTSMEMTEVQTGRIIGVRGPEDPPQFSFPSEESQPLINSQKKKVFPLGQQRTEGLQTSDHKGLKTPSKLSLKMQLKRDHDKVVTADDYREKTIRLSANNSCLDVTQSHTVYIDTDIRLDSHQNVSASPMCGEKTVIFAADDAAMDMTRCLTTTLASDLVASIIKPGDPAPQKLSSSPKLEPAQPNIFTSLTAPNNCDAAVAQKTCAAAETSDGWTVYQEDDMDMTEMKTGCIFGAEVSINMARDQTGPIVEMPVKHAAFQDFLPTGEMHHQSVRGKMETMKQQQHNEVSTADTLMKSSFKTTMQRNWIESDSKGDCGEKTVRFTAADGCMDVTQCNTVNISCDVQFHSLPNMALPSFGEKTIRFDANEAEMDVTRSPAVEISTDLKKLSHQNENLLPASGEKTVRFSIDDAHMDVTRSHTVNIAHGLNLLPHQTVNLLPTDSEENARFSVNDAKKDVTKRLTVEVLSSSNDLPPAKEENQAMLTTDNATEDATQSHAVSIVSDSDQKSTQILGSSLANAGGINNIIVDKTRSGTKSILKSQNLISQPSVDIFPTSGEKSLKYTKNAPSINMTNYLNVNTVSNQSLDPVMLDQPNLSMQEDMNDTFAVKETDIESCGLDSNPFSSAQYEHAALNSSVFQTSCTRGNSKGDAQLCPNLKTKEHDTDAENQSPSLVSGDAGKPVNGAETEEIGATVDTSEDHIRHLVSATDSPHQASSNQDRHSKTFNQSDLTLKNNGALEASESDELEDLKERAETHIPQAMESSPCTADQNTDALPSQTSRRKSLADLKSKIRRLSHLINTAPDATSMENYTTPLPQLDQNPKCKTSSPPPSSPPEPELEVGSRSDANNADTLNPTTAEEAFVAPSTTPFNLKTKQLLSRLSVGGFKPKLPKRKSADELKKSAFEREPTKTFTVNLTNQLSGDDKICIQDEELLDCEDFSETIDATNLENTPKKDSTTNPLPLEDDVFIEDFMSSSQRQKRSLPENEDDKEDEKRQKMCTELSETAFQAEVDSEGSISVARTQTIDSSNSSHAGSRSEIASESTFKHSLFESQLEDYSGDRLTKLEDGTITLLEFFNLLRIDVFIHNCRQSVLPGRLSANTDATPLDSLKDRYINRPKQKVYEKDVQTLTEKVEGLKYRMQDLDKPLKTVNRSLWEEVKDFTEKEFQSFGAKIKERNNFFRKQSKEQGHEMKEVLYANLVLANLEEQQKLRGTINQADEMIQSLDECIGEMEAELDAVEGKGSEEKQGLTSLQEEMSKVTETLADSERQILELVLEKEKKSKDLKRLKSEASDLQSYIDILNTINEWRLEEKKDVSSVYTFLYKTMVLRLVYERNNGDDAESRSEKKITNISFKFNLDEKSHSHACLVHRLVSAYIEGESSWVEKYPTTEHVPKLLRDVSLVVSRCRLVGEELRLLKTSGSLRFDILDLSCSQTQVHIVFSSLRKLAKFEVVFEAALTKHHCVFHVQSFKNLIGSTTIQQIEEIVASLSPGRNLFTRIVKKIHETLLT